MGRSIDFPPGPGPRGRYPGTLRRDRHHVQWASAQDARL